MSRKACSRRPYSPQQPTDAGPFKQATAARPATPASCTARLAASGDARTDIIAPRDGLSAISRPRLRSHQWCLNVVQRAVRAWRSAGLTRTRERPPWRSPARPRRRQRRTRRASGLSTVWLPVSFSFSFLFSSLPPSEWPEHSLVWWRDSCLFCCATDAPNGVADDGARRAILSAGLAGGPEPPQRVPTGDVSWTCRGRAAARQAARRSRGRTRAQRGRGGRTYVHAHVRVTSVSRPCPARGRERGRRRRTAAAGWPTETRHRSQDRTRHRWKSAAAAR